MNLFLRILRATSARPEGGREAPALWGGSGAAQRFRWACVVITTSLFQLHVAYAGAKLVIERASLWQLLLGKQPATARC